MHAERDYLVKQVFPELREWCERRKLNLVDIDLRWGVKEDDTHNKNVVEVCLKRIDDARPFFLCFLGQRRGWVPQANDISSSTFNNDSFPGLETCIGRSSITEMEIIHALIHPFHSTRVHKEQKSEYYEPVKYAFFYLRDPSYLEELPEDSRNIRKIYTNEGLSNKEEQSIANRQLDKWRTEEVPDFCQLRGLPLRHYKAHWNLTASSPELQYPLACSSLIPANQKLWQKHWTDAGVIVKNTIIEDPIQVEKASTYNQKRTKGRLTDFEIDGIALKEIILQDLKSAIEERFPDHQEIIEASDLQKELDQQEQFLQFSREGFISRGDDFKELNQYIQDERKHVFLLTAPGGVGKSTLLANWVEELRLNNESINSCSIHFRFIGQSDLSNSIDSLLYFLLEEIKTLTGKLEDPVPESPTKLRQELVRLLSNIGKNGKTVIILDAVNQLESGLSDLRWIPWQLPENVKLIISFRSGEENADKLLGLLQGQISHSEVQPFINLDDRRKLVKAYLSQYLKDLDEQHIKTLIQSEGASNPLFLKVALSELRVFGSFSNLSEKITHDFGETPQSAFNGVLKRLEEDPAYSTIDPGQAVPLIFGLLAHARTGLSAGDLTLLIIQSLGLDENKKNLSSVTDTVILFLRQVRSFLTHRDGRYDFFFEGFKLAVLQRYTTLHSQQDWHLKLANYFEKLPLWKDKQNFIPTKHKIAELPYHLAMSGQSQTFHNYLTDFDFLQAKIIELGAPALLDDFKFKDLPGLNLDFQVVADMTLIERAIDLSLSNLRIDPYLFAGQLIARLGNINKGPTLGRLLSQVKQWTDRAWIKPLTSHYNEPKSELQISYQASNHYLEAAYSTPDGRILIILSKETEENRLTLKRIEAFTGKVIHQISIENFGNPAHLSLSCDGKKAILLTPKLISIYNAETLALEHAYPIDGVSRGENLNFLRLSPDGLFAFVIEKNWVTQIRLLSGERVRQFEIKRGMSEFIFSRSGKLAAFCISSGRYVENEGIFTKEDYFRGNSIDNIYVWDLQSNAAPKLISSHAICDDFIFSADEEYLICVNELGKVETWQIAEAKSVGNLQVLSYQQYEGVLRGLRYMGTHHRGVAKIVSSADGETALCSFSVYLATINISNPRSVTIEKHLYLPEQTIKLKPAYGAYAICLSATKELIIWNIESGNLMKRLKDNSMIRDFWTAQFGEKTVIFSRNDKNTVCIWDISNMAEPTQGQAPINQAVNNRLFSIKSHPLYKTICVLKTMTIKIFSTSGRSIIGEIRTAPPHLMDMHYHPDSEFLVLVFIDGTIKILSLQNYQSIKLLTVKLLQSSIQTSSLSPDGQWLLYGEKNNCMKMINLVTEEELEFEGTTSLGQEQRWDRSHIVVLPESHQVISFCHVPHNQNPYSTFPGRSKDASCWMEIHDLKTRKFVKRLRILGYYPNVLKVEISKNGRSTYQLIARKGLDILSPNVSYTLEKISSDFLTQQIIATRNIEITDFSISSDESFAILVTNDGMLDFISLHTGEVVSHFRGDYTFTCCSAFEEGTTFCAGDENGEVNFFRIENVVQKVNNDLVQAIEPNSEIVLGLQNTVQKTVNRTFEESQKQIKTTKENERVEGILKGGLSTNSSNFYSGMDPEGKSINAKQPENLANESELSGGFSIELKPGNNMEFVQVPAGEFMMGRDMEEDNQASSQETPQHIVILDEYFIGKYPVTNKQYQVFVNAVGYKQPEHWKNNEIPQGKEDHPVVCVSWEDAVAFCTWASKVSGRKVRLPRESEWEKAARGTDSRTYPWGNNVDKSYANYDGFDTTRVGSYKIGKSPYGAFDMVGNVLEWVDDWYEGYPGNSKCNSEFGTTYRVQRGGNWKIKYEINLRVSYRSRFYPESSDDLGGFRCACQTIILSDNEFTTQ
jgi:formylglycine-generating enzyme required for sulfatase activity